MKRKKKASNSSNYSALAGEFAVLSQLALKGIDASLTLGNTKEVDILISDPKTNESKRLEVKTKTKCNKSGITRRGHAGLFFCEWQMGEKHEKLRHKNLYYCFVLFNQHKGYEPYFFIVPSRIVASYIRKEHKEWKKFDKKHNGTPMRMFRIALDTKNLKYKKPKFATPEYKRYHNNWKVLKKKSL